MDAIHFIFPIISFACVVLNICSLVILYRTLNLQKRRFNCLVLYLSISNTLIGLQALGSAVNYGFVSQGNTTARYTCGIFGIFLRATALFSMYQVFLICVERLNATYTSVKKLMTVLTSDRSVVVGFFLIHCYPVTIWVYNIFQSPPRCVVIPTPLLFVSMDLPVILTMISIGVLYALVIRRLVIQNKTFITTNIPPSQAENRRSKMATMKRYVITLGIIVALNIAIVLPRFSAVVTTLVTGNAEGNSQMLLICTNLLILNPLLDPVIYLLRIRTFRQRLLCCKARYQVRHRIGPMDMPISYNNKLY